MSTKLSEEEQIFKSKYNVTVRFITNTLMDAKFTPAQSTCILMDCMNTLAINSLMQREHFQELVNNMIQQLDQESWDKYLEAVKAHQKND